MKYPFLSDPILATTSCIAGTIIVSEVNALLFYLPKIIYSCHFSKKKFVNLSVNENALYNCLSNLISLLQQLIENRHKIPQRHRNNCSS